MLPQNQALNLAPQRDTFLGGLARSTGTHPNMENMSRVLVVRMLHLIEHV